MTDQPTASLQQEATIPVTITINHADLLGSRQSVSLGMDEYGNPIGHSASLASILADRIVDRAADQIVTSTLDDTLRKLITDKVAAHVDAAIRARLEEPIQAVDEWGTRRGEPMTLREQIGKAVEAWPKTPSGYNRDSNLRKWIEENVDRAVKADLAGAVTEARAQAVARVRGKVAELFAEDATPKVAVR
jgi:hypothetical protein